MRMLTVSAGQARVGAAAYADFEETDDQLTMPVLRNADAIEEAE
jgi:hypothetical protein